MSKKESQPEEVNRGTENLKGAETNHFDLEAAN